MSQTDKINFLFFNNQLDCKTLSIAADMLIALEESHEFLLKLQNSLRKNVTSQATKIATWAAKSSKIEKILLKNLKSNSSG